jgi:Trypsin
MWLKRGIFFQAAHCILETTSSTSIIVGSSRQDGLGGTTHRVSRIAIHPDYRGSSGQLIADIAVVRTTSSITFTNNVRPIVLGTSQVVGANERVTIAGWGLIENNRDPDVLHVLEMVTIGNSACSARHQNTFTNGWITSEKLCTEGINRRAGVCSGDRFVIFNWSGRIF